MALIALCVIAAPAGAVLVTTGGHSYGVTPISGVDAESVAAAHRLAGQLATAPSTPRNFDGPPFGGGPLEYHGGPVMHSVTTHVIYWDPNGEFTATTKGIVGKFFADVAMDSGHASNVFAIGGQYKDATGNAAYSATVGTEGTDSTAYPANGCVPPKNGDQGPYTNCINDAQLQTALSAYIGAHGLPTGPSQQFFVLLPHKVATCIVGGAEGYACSNNFYCAYHGSINEGAPTEIVYSEIPFSLLDTKFVKGCQHDGNREVQDPNGDTAGSNESTRFADVALRLIGHEYMEAVTDPLGDAYYDANGLEIGDKCGGVGPGNGEGIGYDANSFLPTLGGSAAEGTLFDQSIDADSYYLQSLWDNARKACLMAPAPLTARLIAPTLATVGVSIQFVGAATDIYRAPAISWKWGDGTESAGASPMHTYGLPGVYEVTMTVADELTGATTTPVVRTVTVKRAQTIAFTSTAPGSATVGGPAYIVAATASSGLKVSFSSETPLVCSVSGATVSFIAAGMCTLDADQAGNAEYRAAPRMQQPLSVGQGSQTIAFTSTAPGLATVGGPEYTLAATASSGLKVSFSSETPLVCSVSGATVSFIAAGTCTVDANQVGTGNYAAAPVRQQSFVVAGGLVLVAAIPNSSFAPPAVSVNTATGAITLTVSVGDPGTFSWILTFPNGTFGAFPSRNAKCSKGSIKLQGRCRPARITFARGQRFVPDAGTLDIGIAPDGSGLKALKNALRQRNGVPLTAVFTFQSARGGSPVSHTSTVTVKLKRR